MTKPFVCSCVNHTSVHRQRKIFFVGGGGGGAQLLQAKLKHMWLTEVHHMIIITSSTMASRKMAASLAPIATFIFIFEFP